MRWNGTEFVRPHSVRVDSEDNIWLLDDCGHTVTKTDRHGKRLMMLLPGGEVLLDPAAMAAAAGKERAPSPAFKGEPFNRPTDVAVLPNGDFYVTDGYGNARIHHFAKDGRRIASFGEPGTDAGRLSLPHNIVLHGGALAVADRENSRVQLFSLAGEYLSSLHAHRAVALASAGRQLYVAEHGAATGVHRGEGIDSAKLDTWAPHIGHRIGIFSTEEGPAPHTDTAAWRRVAALGAPTPGERPGQLNWPHSIAVDREGSVYAAEVSFCECGAFQTPHAREMVSLRKWRRA